MARKFGQKGGFTVLRGNDIRKTLASKLVSVADGLRNLHTKFGGRVYNVRMIVTEWSGGERGLGTESVIFEEMILPTPKLIDLTTVTQVLNPTGLDEAGLVQVSEISGRYTEDFLLGLDAEGNEPLRSQNVYYEIEFPRADGRPGERRRFGLKSAPSYAPYRMEWTITLESTDENRGRQGELR